MVPDTTSCGFESDTPVTDVTLLLHKTDPNLPIDNETLPVVEFGNTVADENPSLTLRQSNLFAIPDDILMTCVRILTNVYS